MNYLGRYLKKRLKDMKMSEREVASKCGISHSYLNQLIKGINPSTKKHISPTLCTLEKLAEGFEISVEYLQKVTRGIADDKNIDTTGSNLDYSPKLVKQIKDFHDFMQLVGIDKKNKTEEEWAELISEIKKSVKNHLKGHTAVVS